MKEQIKQLRVKIDGLSQLTKELRSNKNSSNWRAFHTRETEKCYDSLLLAKAWLGKVLEELGEPTPYANDGNRKTVEDIEPAADKAKEVTDYPIAPDNWGEGPVTASHIEKVDWLRQEIEKIQKEAHNIQDCGTPISGLLAWNFVYQNLFQARFWLGFELQRVKESEN